jgi:anaerobic selenocysteine-containing dehydrogenase
MGEGDMKRLGLAEGDIVNAWTVADDATRTVHGLRVTRYDIPAGCAAAYYPECNALIPLWHHAKGSCVPAAKSIPIRLRRASSP